SASLRKSRLSCSGRTGFIAGDTSRPAAAPQARLGGQRPEDAPEGPPAGIDASLALVGAPPSVSPPVVSLRIAGGRDGGRGASPPCSFCRCAGPSTRPAAMSSCNDEDS